MRLHRPLIAASLLIAAPAAYAAVTVDQAKSVEGQLQTWYATTFDKPSKPGVRGVQVEPAGERYKITIPLGLKGTNDSPAVVTMLANPTEGGRWMFDGLHLPQPLQYSMTIMPQKPASSAGQKTAPKDAELPVTVQSTITAVSQDGSGVWDPTFATPSIFKQSLTGVVSTSTSAPAPSAPAPSAPGSSAPGSSAPAKPAGTPADVMTQRNTIDQTTTETTLTPNGRDRINIASAGTLTGYALQMSTKDGPMLDVKAKGVSATIGMTAVLRERGVEMIRAISDLVSAGLPGTTASAAGAPAVDPKMSPATYTALHRIVVALPDMGTDAAVDETATDISITAGGKIFAASKLNFGMTVKSTAGILRAALGFTADGLAWPDFGIGDMAQLLPTHLVFRPTLSGAAAQDVEDLLLASIDAGQKGKAGPDDAALKARMLSHGGTVGVEALEFDTAGTTISLTGTVTVQGGPGGTPTAKNGAAHIVARDFDKLTAVMAAQPMLAQGMPAVVFLKGLAKQADGAMVWDVTFDGAKLAVNGTDMSAMMGGPR